MSALELSISSALKTPDISTLASIVSISAFPLKLFTVTDPAAASMLKTLISCQLLHLPMLNLFPCQLFLVQ